MSLAERILAGDPGAVLDAETCLRVAPAIENYYDLRKALVKHYISWDGTARDDGVDDQSDHDSEAALRHLRALYDVLPDDPDLDYQLSSALVGTGRHVEAMRLLEFSLERVEDGSPGRELKFQEAIARVHYVQGRFDRAAALFEQILPRAMEVFGPDLNKDQGVFFGLTLARLSRTLIGAGNYAEAARVIEAFPYTINLSYLNNTLNRARSLLQDELPSQRPDARPVDLDRMTVACVKHGTKYGPEYVNRLYAMVRRALPGNWRFVCLTDDPQGIRDEVGIIDISDNPHRGWWTKLALFDPQTPFADETIFYLDLDTIIIGDLSFIEGLKVGFHVLEHSFMPGYNSSVMLFDRAFAAPVFQRFQNSDAERLLSDQDWLEECMPGLDTFTHGLIRLYRSLDPEISSAELAETDGRIVTFPTVPKPHQIQHGWATEHWR